MALSEKAKKIGNRQAFPMAPGQQYDDGTPGMTYRQWLIGQYPLVGFIGDADCFADTVIIRADAVLEALAAEES